MKIFYHLIALTILLVSKAVAEYSIYALERNSPGNVETVVFYDSWSGCMTFANEIDSWWKESFDSTTTQSIMEFYTGTSCSGSIVGIWNFASVGIKSVQGFSADARSVRVTGNSAKRSLIPTSYEPTKLTLISDGSSRQVVPISELGSRNLLEKRADAFDLVLSGDTVYSLTAQGGWALWILDNVEHGYDTGSALIPTDAASLSLWALTISSEFLAGFHTGELNGNFATWQGVLQSNVLVTAFTAASLKTISYKLGDFGGATGSSYVSYTIKDYLKNSLANFEIWIER